MNSAGQKSSSYSADVRMELRVHGRCLPIGHLGPDFIILDELAEVPPGRAEILMSVDAKVRRWPVNLEDGISMGQPRTRVAPATAV